MNFPFKGAIGDSLLFDNFRFSDDFPFLFFLSLVGLGFFVGILFGSVKDFGSRLLGFVTSGM